jgi:hypothetical protein
MNPQLRRGAPPLVTQAAEGMQRRCFSVAEIAELPAIALVAPMLAPELAVRLSDIGIGPVAEGA